MRLGITNGSRFLHTKSWQNFQFKTSACSFWGKQKVIILAVKGVIDNLCFTKLTLWKIEFHGLVWPFDNIRKSRSWAWLSNTGNRSTQHHFRAATHVLFLQLLATGKNSNRFILTQVYHLFFQISADQSSRHELKSGRLNLEMKPGTWSARKFWDDNYVHI